MKENEEICGPSDNFLDVLTALIEALDEKNEKVKQTVFKSIKNISLKESSTVIKTAIYFYKKNQKISHTHLISIFNIITEICSENTTLLNEDLATSVGDLALNEITGIASEHAAEMLVMLSKNHCPQAVGSLITKFNPDVIPHHLIIHTLGEIAEKQYSEILPFVKVILSVLIPLLPDMTDESLKLASTYTIGKIGDAVADCVTHIDADNSRCKKDMYYEEFTSAYEVLTSSWLRASKNIKLSENILAALVSILTLLPTSYSEKLITKLIPAMLNTCKKPQLRLLSTRVIAIILNNLGKEDKEMLQFLLEQLQQILSELISIAPFEVSRETLLTHYEALHCFQALINLYPEEVLDKILLMLKSQNTAYRSRALVILRHLINTLPAEDVLVYKKIASSLQDSLADGNTRQVVGVIVALAARPMFALLSSQKSAFIKFMILHCGSKLEESEACEEALFLLSNTVNGAEIWLWPPLLDSLLDDSYLSSIVSILKALSPLAVKVAQDEKYNFLLKDFQSIKVLARNLELLADKENRLPVITFLKCSTPLFGEQLKELWDKQLPELYKFLNLNNETLSDNEKKLLWEDLVVKFLEDSASIEGETWSLRLANELSEKKISPELSIIFSALASNTTHITLLIELSRTHSVSSSGLSPTADEYARAVGNCAKRELNIVLKIMEEFCHTEDTRKVPVKLLGLVKDAKAAATVEASKAGLLKAYGEIVKNANSEILFPSLEKFILPWVIKQVNECKELTTKEFGLTALFQIGEAVHSKRLPNSPGLKARGTALATLLALFQFSSGYRPLQLYPHILKAIIALIQIKPTLNNEEKEILLETTMDKIIGGSSDIDAMNLPHIMQQVIEGLEIISKEIVADSPDMLAILLDILLPWMQSKSLSERRTTLLVLKTTLQSYYNSIKFTYPEGKLEPGKLLGRLISWSADSESSLRLLVIDCVALTLNIASRHRSTNLDEDLDQNLNELKKDIVTSDNELLYKGIANLGMTSSKKIAIGEVMSFIEGLIEGLLYRGTAGTAAGIALSELFKVRGSDIPRSNLHVIDSIIGQMRQMENVSCKRESANAIKSLSMHHPLEVVEHLLQQPLPLDRSTIECWKILGNSEKIGSQIIEIIISKLNNDSFIIDNNSSPNGEKRSTVNFTSLACVIATGYILSSPVSENIIIDHLAELLAVFLKYLSGWIHAETPMSVINTKFGFVPNRDSCKIIPSKEVYTVLKKMLNAIDFQDGNTFLFDSFSESESDAEGNLITTIQVIVKCLLRKNEILINLSQILGKLVTSTLPTQRAASITLYAELIGKIQFDPIWLESVMTTLHEAKADSSSLVRKQAIIGLSKIVYLEPKQTEEYFNNSLEALLDSLEEPCNTEGSMEIIINSLKGLSLLLCFKTVNPISPRTLLTLKPFIEKENWEMRLAAISALNSIIHGWQQFVFSPDDDITDHLLGCLPCLIIKLEDSKTKIALTAKEALINSANLMQCQPLSQTIKMHLQQTDTENIELFLKELIDCLKEHLPERAEELRNAVVQGYSRSENSRTRSTSAVILGLFKETRQENIQRLLQLLKDQESIVKEKAALAIASCYIEY